ncbi:MAG: FmdB family transcriptional regulator [Trueperaceae bacterium]
MPVYVYKNLTTGATFEVEQRITEAALTADPATGDPVKRVIQPVGIAFKGSGFYVTDSRGKNGATKPAAKADQAKTESPKADTPPPPSAAASAPAAASGTD